MHNHKSVTPLTQNIPSFSYTFAGAETMIEKSWKLYVSVTHKNLFSFFLSFFLSFFFFFFWGGCLFTLHIAAC